MNEQIRELMNQAGTDTSGKWMSVDNLDKFSELIIQECCSIADGWVNNLDDDKNYPSERIKQHFGVEE